MHRKRITPPMLLNWVFLMKSHPTKKEMQILHPRLLLRNPGQNGLKCNSSWWQLWKEPKVYQKIPNKDPIRVREGTFGSTSTSSQRSQWPSTAETAMLPKIIKLRLGGITKTRSNARFSKVGGICSSAQHARPLNSQRGEHSRTSSQYLDWTWNLCQCWHQTSAKKHSSQSSIS